MIHLTDQRPGSSVGSSVRLKSERSPVRFRPWPPHWKSDRSETADRLHGPIDSTCNLPALSLPDRASLPFPAPEGTQLRRRQHIANDRVRAPRAEVAGTEVDQRLHPVPAAKQVSNVQHDPPDPGRDTFHLDPDRHLENRVAATDGGHDALVVVREILRVESTMQPGDLPGGELPHLDSRLPQLRQRVVHDDTGITDSKNSLLTHDTSVAIDLNPPGPSDRQSPILHSTITGNSCCPDHEIDRHGRAVFEVDAIGLHLSDRGVEPNVDT